MEFGRWNITWHCKISISVWLWLSFRLKISKSSADIIPARLSVTLLHSSIEYTGAAAKYFPRSTYTPFPSYPFFVATQLHQPMHEGISNKSPFPSSLLNFTKGEWCVTAIEHAYLVAFFDVGRPEANSSVCCAEVTMASTCFLNPEPHIVEQ